MLLNTHLEDEAIALVAQLGDKVIQELGCLGQGPEIFSPYPEGLLIVAVQPASHFAALGFYHLSLLDSGTHHSLFYEAPPVL